MDDPARLQACYPDRFSNPKDTPAADRITPVRGPRAGRLQCCEDAPSVSDRRTQAAFFAAVLPSKNCSSSVEPLSAAVDDSRSIVVVTASK